jgi:hypothetical protein
MYAPKDNLEKFNRVITGWQTLAQEKSFGGMTLAQFKTALQPSFDIRTEIERLEDELTSAKTRRDAADKESLRRVQLVVNGVYGDPEEGPDGDLYESFGYVRDSERKSGLTRGKKKKDSGDKE